MYHGPWCDDFVGIEGPRDGEVGVIFASSGEGEIKAVLCSFASHPNCLQHGNFYSADLPGEVRKVLRGVLGEHVGVIYMTGAAGDTAPTPMDAQTPEQRRAWSNEVGAKRSGWYLGGEMLKVIGEQIDQPMTKPEAEAEDEVTLELVREDLSVSMRPWDPWFDVNEEHPNPDKRGMDWFFHDSYAKWEAQVREESPVTVPVTVLRIGDTAICTNPSELFCQFGLAIKQRSPARVTLISELAEGYVGYVPTPQAIRHGGYSAAWAKHTNLQADAGWQIVEASERLLNRAFKVEHAPTST